MTKLNGEVVDSGQDVLLSDFLIAQGFKDLDRVVATLNGEIVTNDEFGTIVVKLNDELEVLRFVGGG
jgi:thiamine biosynthesis protein ThiS